MESLPLLIMVVLAFVLLIVLPARQRKKMQANAQTMQNSLTIGTPVMLTSGIHGSVAGLGEGTVDVQVAPGVVITVARPAIMEIRKPAADAVSTDSPSGATSVDGDGDATDLTR